MNSRNIVSHNGMTNIDLITGDTSSDKLAVTFSFPNQPDLGVQEIFLQRGYDVLDVRGLVSNWYQDLTIEHIKEIREALPQYTRTVTYGTSVAGYAALYFAAALGACRTMAISPQAGVNDPASLFDPRWHEELSRIEKTHRPLGEVLPGPEWQATIIFDPHEFDAQHAKAISALAVNTVLIPVPYSGHLSGAMLNELGLIGRLIESLDSDGKPDISREIRNGRWRSSNYCFALGMACWNKGRLATAAQLLERAVAIGDRPDVAIEYSRLLLQMKRPQEALKFAEEGTRLLPPNPHRLTLLGFLHEVNGNLEGAAINYDKAVALDPSLPAFHENSRRILRIMLEKSEAKAAQIVDHEEYPHAPVGKHAPGWGESTNSLYGPLALLIPFVIVVLLWFTSRAFNWI